MSAHIDTKDKYSCCGCGACKLVCPTDAIAMINDEEGFLYPDVEEEQCIQCGKCTAICAFKRDRKITPLYSEKEISKVLGYAAKHKSHQVRSLSRSGGAFTALTDIVLDSHGVVYGCVMDGASSAFHARAENELTRNSMRGSKYIESDLRDSFQEVENDLKSGKNVIFSGTSCQVAALRSYLGTEYKGLFCIDIVCHGVPSKLVWSEYVRWMEKRQKAQCIAVDFRNKEKYGWRAHFETLYFKNEEGQLSEVSSEVFKLLFYSHLVLRKSCYACPYKSLKHPGDLTLGDCWGVEKVAPAFNDDKGASLILINTAKGLTLFEQCKDSLDFEKVSLDKCMQPPLVAPYPEPKGRHMFWERFFQWDFSKIANTYGKRTLISKCKAKIKRTIPIFNN